MRKRQHKPIFTFPKAVEKQLQDWAVEALFGGVSLLDLIEGQQEEHDMMLDFPAHYDGEVGY